MKSLLRFHDSFPPGEAFVGSFGSVLLLLPGQFSDLIGGVMTPPYRRDTSRKKAPVSEETGASHIAYRDAPPQSDHTCFTRVIYVQ